MKMRWFTWFLALVSTACGTFGEHLLDRFSSVDPFEGKPPAHYFPLYNDLKNQGLLSSDLEVEFGPIWRETGLWLNSISNSNARWTGEQRPSLEEPFTISLWMHISSEHTIQKARPFNGYGVFWVFWAGSENRPDDPAIELIYNNALPELSLNMAGRLKRFKFSMPLETFEQDIHLTWVDRGSEILIYKNGQFAHRFQVEQDSRLMPGNIIPVTIFQLEGSPSHVGPRMVLNEFAYWERPLNEVEVQDWYQSVRRRHQRHGNLLKTWLYPSVPAAGDMLTHPISFWEGLGWVFVYLTALFSWARIIWFMYRTQRTQSLPSWPP